MLSLHLTSLHLTSLPRALAWRLFQISATARALTPGELRKEAEHVLWCGVLVGGGEG